MLNEKIVPANALEEAVIAMDNAAVVELIANGAELSRPDVLATANAFDLRYPVAVLLLESSSCLHSAETVTHLEKLGAHPEMVELLRDVTKPLPENTHPKSGELLEALKNTEFLDAANLLVEDQITLSAAPLEYFNCLGDFPEFLVEAMFEKVLDARLKAQLFLHLRNKAKEGAANAEFIFEVLKMILTDNSLQKTHHIHALWRKHTTSAYIKAVEREAEKFSHEYLADMIIDQELEFDSRPFAEFPPYYQALMRNNGGVGLEQFDDEAEIEKFDAKAVFELLSGGDDYADRVNWELVNKTAKASDYLKFLAKYPDYADKADWQMINVQADAKDWFDFLEQQPQLLRKCRDHKMLYLADPERWQQITENSGFRFGTCFAFLCRIEDEWMQLFKVLIRDGKATFSEVSDLDAYQEFSDMAQKDFQAFCGKLQSFEEADRFVNIIR